MTIPHPVTLSEGKGLGLGFVEILRFAQNDKRGGQNDRPYPVTLSEAKGLCLQLHRDSSLRSE